MTGRVAIRRATVDDAATVAAIVQRAYRGYIERLGRTPAPMGVDYVRAIAGAEVHVAVCDADIVGLVALADDDAGFMLRNLAVAPD